MADHEAMLFKEGDTVTVFEGTHHYVRGHRTTKFIGRVVGFDTEKQMWKVITQNLTQTTTLTLILTLTILTLKTTLSLPLTKVRNVMLSRKGNPILVDGRFMQTIVPNL